MARNSSSSSSNEETFGFSSPSTGSTKVAAPAAEDDFG
jgi:hypothetical protein